MTSSNSAARSRAAAAAATPPATPSTPCSASAEPAGGRRARVSGSRRAAAAVAIALLAACSSSDPARGAAERFLDAYYVEMDLPRARDAAGGLARAKVEEQIRLLAGQPLVEGAGRPSVHYRFLEQSGDDDRDRRGFLFELTISLGADALVRRALVTVRQEADGWHAVNFQEMD